MHISLVLSQIFHHRSFMYFIFVRQGLDTNGADCQPHKWLCTHHVFPKCAYHNGFFIKHHRCNLSPSRWLLLATLKVISWKSHYYNPIQYNMSAKADTWNMHNKQSPLTLTSSIIDGFRSAYEKEKKNSYSSNLHVKLPHWSFVLTTQSKENSCSVCL